MLVPISKHTSLYLRIWDPADLANLPLASLLDCLPPALALQARNSLISNAGNNTAVRDTARCAGIKPMHASVDAAI